MFLIKRCSISTIKSYHRWCSPQASVSSKNPQIQQVVLKGKIGFSLINICFLISSNSRNLGSKIFENQLLNVSMVNFNSIENSSASQVDFSRSKTEVAAYFS